MLPGMKFLMIGLLSLTFGLASIPSSGTPYVSIAPPKTLVPVKGPWLRMPVIPDPNWKPGHRGLDIGANTEQMVLAPRSGRVAFANYINNVGSVSITTYDGYRHIVTFVEPTVERDQYVRAGEQIGWVSESSHCKRTCVHWAVKHFGRYVDPRWLLPKMLVRIRRAGGLG